VPCKVRAEVLNLVCQVLNPKEKRTNERDGSPKSLSGEDSSSPARKRARVSFQMDAGVELHTDAGPGKPPERSRGRSYALEKEVSKSELEATKREMEISEREKDRRREKACKSDDAAVPVFLWNDRVKAGLDYMIAQVVTEVELEAALDTIRGFLLRYWKRKVTRDFIAWWEDQHVQAKKVGGFPDLRSLEARKVAISHANSASWWEWDCGSALFFWGEEVPDRNA